MIFLEEKTHRVELSSDDLGSLGEGKLIFGGGLPISVQLSMMSPLQSGETEYPVGVVHAKSEKGQSFTLHECKAYGQTIYAEYLIVGHVPVPQFQRIDVRYSDVSEWFLQWRRIEGKVGERLTWSGLPDEISADFEDSGRWFHLITEYDGQIVHNGKDHVLHEYIEFALQPATGLLTLLDAKEKAMELACLLSILIAQPTSVLEVAVQTPAGRYFSLYFPTFKPVARDASVNDFVRDCFVQKHWLDGKWETILRQFFNSPHRKIRWTRLAGMQRYEGFWEYNALGYVFLLDSYVSHNPPKKAVKPPRPEGMRRLQGALGRFVPPLDQNVLSNVLEAVRETFSYPQEAKFPEKYAAAIDSTDADIVKIIHLSDENFRLIKKVRDKVAHGQALELEEEEFQQIHIVVSRIELLLTYWAYLDFGLSKEDFLKGLGSPFTRLRRLAQIDEKHLARVTDSAEFFSLDANSFGELSSRNLSGVFACFTVGPDREIVFSNHFTKMHKDWNLKHRKGTSTIDQIFGVAPDVVRHVSHLYIECGEQSLEFHSAYLFDTSKLSDTPPSKGRVV
ncbi:ApeA N-terminal domain 1-containing protein [Burkholderia pseudomallei]|uniref:ApeA N-terminal domain 1-containing protein n=1 Tax=Burkholderia pseudomallei TaxID=28450 RepID=UPI0005E4DF00|nr:HEPN domain-containing protein [Burkholderia pseudomallei]MBF3693651.1 hypothetical protein [Burkholderia pseudomallei]MDV2126156.1 hypothetical protein [Burkholderia pseudomallei]MDV2227822.1 hypothetical protein [Burkholderia pseudomallei]CAJ3473679.1 Uncharacterised protein [Burkholderia pseudomallei]CAJ8004368.1 Uncharacterised protein [Burkholderia pseudomallei]